MGWSEYRRSSSEGLTCVVVSFQLEEAEWVGLSIEEALQKVQDIQDAKPVIPLKEYLTCVVVSFQLEEAELVGLSIKEALQKV